MDENSLGVQQEKGTAGTDNGMGIAWTKVLGAWKNIIIVLEICGV